MGIALVWGNLELFGLVTTKVHAFGQRRYGTEQQTKGALLAGRSGRQHGRVLQ